MRTRLLTFVTTAAAFALAAPAGAQVQQRDHRKPRPHEVVPARPGRGVITVDGFNPQSGPIGTQVTITGTGFTPQTKALVGGRPVKATDIQPTFIKFNVPGRPGDGAIVLRHPGVANDVAVGTFMVIADPEIRSFAPAAGIVGSRVEIRGTGFMNGDQVLIGNRPMPINEGSETRLVVTVPQGAVTDFIVVARPGGQQSRSRARFSVLLPNPIVTSFSPQGGPAGTQVRLTGENFDAKGVVMYGRMPARIVGMSPTTIDVLVPANATTSELFLVRTPQGDARTAQAFALEMPPLVARFTPLFGVVGQRVEIFGDHFMPGDQVSLSGRRLRILQLNPNQIAVEIPNGAQSGPFVIERGQLRATSAEVFYVVAPPVIAGFEPAGGEPNTQVTIRGNNFTAEAEVFYGAQKLRVIARQGDSQLVVSIPPRATNQQFTVRTRGGEAQSATAFQVFVYATVMNMTPSRGPAGTRVTISGRNLAAVDALFINQAQLPITERGRDALVITIPQGLQSGRLDWVSFGKRFTSRFTFTVLEPPILTGFSPNAGPPGTEVVIDGDHFTGDTIAFFGNLPVPVVRRALPRQLSIVIPANATGTDYLWIEDSGARVRARAAFQVLSPATISGISPLAGVPGTEVTIAGANFTNRTEVLFDNQLLPVVRRQLPGTLVVVVPGANPGRHYFSVRDAGQQSRAPQPFMVQGYATITAFVPPHGRAGDKITVRGVDLKPTVRIFYGNDECQLVTVEGNGRSAVVIIPEKASGKGYFWVEDAGKRARSPQQFLIDERPTEVVPSRRGGQ